MKELKHALVMSRHAIDRGRFARFNEGTPSDLKKELQKIIKSHEKQWLARNRKGGLKESCKDLQRTEQFFEESK